MFKCDLSNIINNDIMYLKNMNYNRVSRGDEIGRL